MHRSAVRMLFWAGLAIAMAGCESETLPAPGATAGCTSAADCPAGNTCVANTCKKLCFSVADCARGERCGGGGVCELPDSGPLPVIDGVLGNDPADALRVLDGLVVQGTAFADATFALRTAAGDVALSARAQSDSTAEVLLPIDVRSGLYDLVVANASGADQQPIQLTLPDLTGDVLLQRLNGASGTVAMARLPVGDTAGTVAAGDHLHDARYYPRADAEAQFATKDGVGGGGNLLANVYFSEGAGGLGGWTASGGSVVAAAASAPFGPLAFANDVVGAGASLSSAMIPLAPEQTYMLVGWAVAAAGSIIEVTLGLEFFDAAGGSLGESTVGDPAASSWARFELLVGPLGDVAIPAGAASMKAHAYPNGKPLPGGADGTVQIQGLSLTLASGLRRGDQQFQLLQRLAIGTNRTGPETLDVLGTTRAGSLVVDNTVDVGGNSSVGGDLDVAGSITGDFVGSLMGVPIVAKSNNNGTLSCKAFCAGTYWGWKGACLIAYGVGTVNANVTYDCDEVPGFTGDGNENTLCYCLRR